MKIRKLQEKPGGLHTQFIQYALMLAWWTAANNLQYQGLIDYFDIFFSHQGQDDHNLQINKKSQTCVFVSWCNTDDSEHLLGQNTLRELDIIQ